MGISIGMVGLGSFGSEFVGLFASHPLVDRIALCDQESDRLNAWTKWLADYPKFNPRDAFSEFDDICRSDLDALVIITQHWLHAPMSAQAMEHGKHVYCAVPLITIPDADEIIDWCGRIVQTTRRTGQHFMFGETTYYRPQAMYCRRRAAEGAFGDFVYAEGEYFHDVDHGLRDVWKNRFGSRSGKVHLAAIAEYTRRGIVGGPMHYPTHSTGGPVCVMNAHATKVAAFGYKHRGNEPYFSDGNHAFSNETGLFTMSNGAIVRICEYREIGHRGREIFRVYGNRGSFENDNWCDKQGATPVTVEQMRDPLPEAVVEAFANRPGRPDRAKLSTQERKDFLGGHGGSHGYLVHEFVDAVAADRTPACTALDAARYTAMGACAHKSALRDGELIDVPDFA